MGDRTKLGKAVGKIVRGYFFIYFHINIETLDILPDWLGYVFILAAIGTLEIYEREAGLLKPLGAAIILYEGVTWVVQMLGLAEYLWWHQLVSMIMGIIMMYFHFQLLTNLAGISRDYGCSQTEKIKVLRTVNTLILTLYALPFNWKEDSIVVITLAVLGMIVLVWICIVLRRLKVELLDGEYVTL